MCRHNSHNVFLQIINSSPKKCCWHSSMSVTVSRSGWFSSDILKGVSLPIHACTKEWICNIWTKIYSCLLEYWVTRYSVQSVPLVSLVNRQQTETVFRPTRVPPLLPLVPVSLPLFRPDMVAVPA